MTESAVAVASAGDPGASVASGVLWIECRCGRRLRVKPEWGGRSIRCPRCEAAVQVPQAAASADTAKSEDDAHVDFARLADELERTTEASAGSGAAQKRKRTLSWLRFRKIVRLLQSTETSTAALAARKGAIATLGESRDPRAIDLVLRETGNSSPEIREAAAAALGLLGDARTVPPLVRLLADESATVRRAAVTALGECASPLAVRPLLHYGLSDPLMKFLASESLVRLGGVAVPELLASLNHSDTSLVVESVVALGRIKDRRAVKPLVAIADGRGDARVRCHAVEALGQIADPQPLEVLRRLLDEDDAALRAGAAAALGAIPDPGNVVPLIRALDDACPEVVAPAIAALGELKDRQAVGPLRRLLDSADRLVRIAAAEALVSIGDTEALDPLLKLLRDSEDEKHQVRVLAALRRLGNPEAVPALMPMLDDDNPHVRQRVVDVLGRFGDAVVAERLEEVLRRDRSEDVRASAARALGEIADPMSIDCLMDALQDAFPVRCRAAIALGAIRNEAALPGLLSLLADITPEARFHAAGALGELGSPKAIDPLKRLLADPVPMVQRAALKSLQQLGEPADERAMAPPRHGGRLLDLAASLRERLAEAPKAGVFIGGAALAAVVLVGAGGYFAFGLLMSEAPRTVAIRGNVQSLDFSEDGRTLAVGRNRGMIEVWSLADQPALLWNAPTGGNSDVALASGETVVAAQGGKLLLWTRETAGADAPTELEGHRGGTEHLLVSADGTRAVSIAESGLATLWNLRAKQPEAALQLPKTGLRDFALSPDGSRLAAIDAQARVLVWDTGSAQQILELTGLPEQALLVSLAFSNDGTRIAATAGATVRVWDSASGDILAEFDAERPISRLLFHPDSERLICLHSGTELRVWDPAGESRALDEVETDELTALDVSGDGRHLAAGSRTESPVWLFDLESGKLLHEINLK